MEQSITFQAIKDELRSFYYHHQDDEERYPHFRPCDKIIDCDMEGEIIISYIYFD